jgi:c-di-GMP-binding flagellar brake protein YcgR
MEKKEERREFFRVDGRVHVYYRKISEQERQDLLDQKRGKERPPVDRDPGGGEKDLALGDTSPFQDLQLEELRGCLQRLEEKLDLIIQQVISHRRDDEDVHFEPCFVNISGSGMRLPTRERFEVGDCLEIRVLLPIMPNKPIRLLGEVVHIMETSERVCQIGKKFPFDTGVKFISLLEEDRERIVQYTFHQQAREIRDIRTKLPT